MDVIMLSILVVGGTGLFIGIFLGFSGEAFSVPVDPKEQEVLDALPGVNCGACGYPGCAGLAAAIAAGTAKANACPVGGDETAKVISEIMDTEAGKVKRMVAFVKCKGTPENAKDKYQYYGVEDCKMAEFVPGGGPKVCTYGCTGFGTCVKACPFDAIHIVNGIAQVNKEKCKACNMCVSVCPKHIIELVPYESKIYVGCSSKDKPREVKQACNVGCVGCKMCERACKYDAIKVIDNIAHIDYSKCTMCGECVLKCPSKIILKEKGVVAVAPHSA